jgi:hypothetical protein
VLPVCYAQIFTRHSREGGNPEMLRLIQQRRLVGNHLEVMKH